MVKIIRLCSCGSHLLIQARTFHAHPTSLIDMKWGRSRNHVCNFGSSGHICTVTFFSIYFKLSSRLDIFLVIIIIFSCHHINHFYFNWACGLMMKADNCKGIQWEGSWIKSGCNRHYWCWRCVRCWNFITISNRPFLASGIAFGTKLLFLTASILELCCCICSLDCPNIIYNLILRTWRLNWLFYCLQNLYPDRSMCA